MTTWLPLVVSLITAAIVVVVPLIGVLRGLNANKPVTEATADKTQADANASNFATQQGVIKTLDEQVKRQDVQITKQDERISTLEDLLRTTSARLEDRDEQNELMAEQVRTAQDEARTLRRYLTLCEKSGRMMSDWMAEHYAAVHPGEQPQVQFFKIADEKDKP